MTIPRAVRVGAARARWEFAPRGSGRVERDEEARLRSSLESALRAGHGLGVRFRLEIERRPESGLAVEVEDGRSEAWAVRVLLDAYPPGGWRRTGPPRARPETERWLGWRRSLPSEASAPVLEVGRLVRSLAAAVQVGSPGTSIAVDLAPASSPRPTLLDRWWPPTPLPWSRGDRDRRPEGGSSPTAPREAPRRPSPLAWSMTFELRTGRPALEVERAAASARTAWCALDGTPLELRPAGRWAWARRSSLLSETELLTLLPSPWASSPASGPRPKPGLAIPLGRTRTGEPVGLPLEADQGRHFAVLGETGMGKSSLLVAIARRAPRGAGVVVLDPLGETATLASKELRASGREPIWIAPESEGAELNALAGISASLRTDPVRGERGLESLVRALRQVRAGRYADSPYWGPRLEEMLLRSLRAAATLPEGTLEDAHAILARAGTARAIVPGSVEGEVRALEARVRDRPDDAEGARRLLFEIVRNPTLARLLCSRGARLSVPELVAPGRAVVISGDASRVGESTARYLVATYLALVWSELLSRPPGAKTFVLLDEAQWFAHEGLAEMLRLARRRNVHVGVATQSLASLPEDVQEALRTNVADLVVFRGSPEAAQALARANPAVPASGLLGLTRGEAAVLLGKGESVQWIRTARLPEPSDPVATDPKTGTLLVPAASASQDAGTRAEVPGPDPLVKELRAQLDRRSSLGAVEVDLAHLRTCPGIDAGDLRALGATLGRRGAIVRRERGSNGPVWWVDAEGLARTLDELARRAPPGDSRSAKHL